MAVYNAHLLFDIKFWVKKVRIIHGEIRYVNITKMSPKVTNRYIGDVESTWIKYFLKGEINLKHLQELSYQYFHFLAFHVLVLLLSQC